MTGRSEFDEKEKKGMKIVFDLIGSRVRLPINEFIREVQNAKQSQQGKKRAVGATARAQEADNERRAKVLFLTT